MVTNPMLDPVQRLLLSEASVRALTESRLHAFLLLTPRGEILGCNGLAQEMAQRHFARPLATGEILDFPFDEAQRAEFRRRLRETLKGRAGSSRFSVWPMPASCWPARACSPSPPCRTRRPWSPSGCGSPGWWSGAGLPARTPPSA